jgi:hypothetical protein
MNIYFSYRTSMMNNYFNGIIDGTLRLSANLGYKLYDPKINFIDIIHLNFSISDILIICYIGIITIIYINDHHILSLASFTKSMSIPARIMATPPRMMA